MVIAGAQIGSAAAPYFTVPHPITYTVGGVKLLISLGVIWKGLPSVHFEYKF